MNERGSIVGEEVRVEIERFLNGLEFLPSIKSQINDILIHTIDKDKVSEILNSRSYNSLMLTNEEEVELLKALYEFTKDERFNINKLNSTSSNNEDEENKKPKEDDESLYYDFDYKKSYTTENYKESTQRVVLAMFRRTAVFENKYNKDLYNFNVSEMREVLKALNSKTVRSLQNLISAIEQYIDYAIADDRTDAKYNSATEFDSKEKIKPLLSPYADNLIFDREEIMDMAMNADNAQDGVILGLLFDGVSHKNEFEELINLKKEDIDFEERIVKLSDRDVKVSEETMILINSALKQNDVYVSISQKQDKVRTYKITNGNHVLRGLRGKEKVQPQIISQRILRMAEYYGHKHLNATNIAYSGQLDLAKKLMGKCSLDAVVNKVLKTFGVNINTSSEFYLKNRIEKFLNIH